MRLTTKLIGFLNRIWDKTPDQFLALRLNYTLAPGMTWEVSDGFLTTTVPTMPGANLSVDLSQYTLAGLAAFLSAQTGYAVSDLYTAGNFSPSALVLVDGAGDPAQSDGDHLYGFSSLTWAYLDAIAAELNTAQQQIVAIPSEMSVATADGEWLDLLGSYYAVPRAVGESDAQYAPRMIAVVLQARSNNIAIGQAITAAIGQPATVVDAVEYGATTPLYDSLITFDGAHDYSASAEPIYNLFDVTTGYDLLGGGDPTAFLLIVAGIVESMRAAGTFLRSLLLSGSVLSDAFAGPADATSGMSAAVIIGDALASPADTSSPMPVSFGATPDAFTPPGDGTDDLEVSYTTKFNGAVTYGGSRPYASGYRVDQSISGVPTGTLTPL